MVRIMNVSCQFENFYHCPYDVGAQLLNIHNYSVNLCLSSNEISGNVDGVT